MGGPGPPNGGGGAVQCGVSPHLGCPLPWGKWVSSSLGASSLLGGFLSPGGVPFPRGGAVPALQPTCAPSAAARVTRRRRAATLSRCCASGEAAAPEPPTPKGDGDPPKRGHPMRGTLGVPPSPHPREQEPCLAPVLPVPCCLGVTGAAAPPPPAPPGLCCSRTGAAPQLGPSPVLSPSARNKYLPPHPSSSPVSAPAGAENLQLPPASPPCCRAVGVWGPRGMWGPGTLHPPCDGG